MSLIYKVIIVIIFLLSIFSVVSIAHKARKRNDAILESLLHVIIYFNSIWYSVIVIQIGQSIEIASINLAVEISFSSLLFIVRFIFLFAFFKMILLILNFEASKRFFIILRRTGIVLISIWILGWLEFFIFKSKEINNRFIVYTDILLFFSIITSCFYLLYQTKQVHLVKSQLAIRVLCLIFLIPMILGFFKWLIGGSLNFENLIWERLYVHFLIFLINVFMVIWLFLYSNRLIGFKVLGIDKIKIDTTDLIIKYNISKREKEVIQLICEGYTNKDIAEKLFISIDTVKDHNSRIFQKTGVKNRTQLAKLFLR